MSDQIVHRRLYAPYSNTADYAARALQEAGARVRHVEGSRTLVASGPRSLLNRVTMDLQLVVVPPRGTRTTLDPSVYRDQHSTQQPIFMPPLQLPQTGVQPRATYYSFAHVHPGLRFSYELSRGIACAGYAPKFNWRVPFTSPKKLEKAMKALQVKGIHVEWPRGRAIVIHDVDEDQILQFTKEGLLDGSQKAEIVGEGEQHRHQRTSLPSESKYRGMPGRVGGVFLKWVIHFASVLAAERAQNALHKRGIDTTQLDPEGNLIVGLRDVLARVATEIAQQFGGQVTKKTTTDQLFAPRFATPAHPPEQVSGPAPQRKTRQGEPFKPPKPPLLQKHERTSQGPYKLRKKGAAFSVDWTSVAYGVMDALSDEASRRVIDALSRRGIRAVKKGADKVMVRVRSRRDWEHLKGMARALGERVRLVNKGGSDAGMGLAAPIAPMLIAFLKFAAMGVAESVGFFLATKGLEAVTHGDTVKIEGVSPEQVPELNRVAKRNGGRLVVKGKGEASFEQRVPVRAIAASVAPPVAQTTAPLPGLFQAVLPGHSAANQVL